MTRSGVQVRCAGGDLASMAEAGEEVDLALKELTDQCHSAFSTMMRMRAPVIVAVNGAAAGIGLSLALVGDITIASEKASFTMAYTAAGLSPDGGSTYLLPRAKRLAQGATDAYGSVKSLLLTGFSESLETQMALEAHAIGKNSKGADGQEGISAFLEKRRPHFKG